MKVTILNRIAILKTDCEKFTKTAISLLEIMRELCAYNVCQWLEAVSQVSESDDEAGDMEKGVIHQQGAVVTHDQPAEIAQPGKGAFDFPTLAVAAQRPAILGGWFGSVAAVRADQLDVAGLEL